MGVAYMGDTEFAKCYVGDGLVTQAYLADHEVCNLGYFSMHVQMAPGKYNTKPTLGQLSIDGHSANVYKDITYTNEGSGRWHVWTYSRVSHFGWRGRATIGVQSVVINYSEHMTSTYGMFWDHYDYMSYADFRKMNTKKIKDVGKMFEDCPNMKTCHLGNWDLTSLTSITYLFEGCTDLSYLNLSNWDTSNVSTFESLFEDCVNLRHITELNTTRPGANKHLMFANTNFTQPDWAARNNLTDGNGADWRHPQIPTVITNFNPVNKGGGTVQLNFTKATQEDPGYNPKPTITHQLWERSRRDKINSNVNPGDIVSCPTGTQNLLIVAVSSGQCGTVGINSNTVARTIT